MNRSRAVVFAVGESTVLITLEQMKNSAVTSYSTSRDRHCLVCKQEKIDSLIDLPTTLAQTGVKRKRDAADDEVQQVPVYTREGCIKYYTWLLTGEATVFVRICKNIQESCYFFEKAASKLVRRLKEWCWKSTSTNIC